MFHFSEQIIWGLPCLVSWGVQSKNLNNLKRNLLVAVDVDAIKTLSNYYQGIAFNNLTFKNFGDKKLQD